MISEKDLIAMRKINGETFVKTTKKGDERSAKVLREFIAYGEIANMSKKTDSGDRFVAKGAKSEAFKYDPELQSVQKRLAEKISEINLPFENELENIEED